MDHEPEPTVPSTERPVASPLLADPYSFCGSCGRKNCPEIRTDAAGSVVISEERESMIDRITERPGIVFTVEQARELKNWLQAHGF